jgi:1-aminocyclopropane-1-carboxylate deaminase/D-cysteine desulfhydrase-like pyridoxal-dependent ACC family enzyme
MAVSKARGSSFEKVEAIRQKKAAERGGFEKRILLTEVHELEKAELLLKKKVDWSVFKDGFAIPLEMQDTFLQLPGMQIAPGENVIFIHTGGMPGINTPFHRIEIEKEREKFMRII